MHLAILGWFTSLRNLYIQEPTKTRTLHFQINRWFSYKPGSEMQAEQGQMHFSGPQKCIWQGSSPLAFLWKEDVLMTTQGSEICASNTIP